MISKIALLGANGFIGNRFNEHLSRTKHKIYPITRKECNLLDKLQTKKILKEINPDYIINSAGFTGKPNVDACELDQKTCWAQNYTLPKYLAEICNDLNKKWLHVSSGCIYSGSKNGEGFNENDEPNFSFDKQPCSFYSGTKAIAEDLLKKENNVYIARLRIPFDDSSSPKNYLTKLLNYNVLLNVENSMTNTQEFIEACCYLLLNEKETGIYNVTNTGSINTFDITKLLNKHITRKKFTFFENEEEFYKKAAKTPRSNCVLDNSKLLKNGFKIENIHDKIESCIKNYL
jgi:UDP-glucose 4,6-dehydratase